MKRFIPLLLAPLLAGTLALPPRPAAAATLSGVTLPDAFPYGGQNLRLNGLALRTLTILSVRIYVIGLYLPQPAHDARAIEAAPGPKVLLLQFLHDATKAEFQKEYREGERNNCSDGSCPKSAEADFERLVADAPSLKVGDTLTYVVSGAGLRVLLNNRQIGNYANPALATEILNGFIGDHPPSPAIKQSLLGLKGG